MTSNRCAVLETNLFASWSPLLKTSNCREYSCFLLVKTCLEYECTGYLACLGIFSLNKVAFTKVLTFPVEMYVRNVQKPNTNAP